MMTDRVTVYRWDGTRNNHGRPNHQTVGTEYICRITYKDKIVRAPDAGERTSHARVILDRAPGITVHDKVVIAGRDPSPILAVQRYSDEYGPYYESFDLA